MKRMSCLIAVLALISIMMLGVCMPSHAGEVRGVTKDTVKIGVINDMTGPAATTAAPVVEAQRDYFRWVNENGGVHGRKIKLIVEDDRYSIPMAVAAFKKLVYKDEVLCITGPTGTGQHTVLFRHFEKMRIPSLGISISEALWIPYKRYIFPPPGDYHDLIGVAYDYILKNLKPKEPKIAIVRSDTEFGKVCRAAAKKWADFHNLELYEEIMAIGAVDVSSQVISLKRGGVNNIIAAGITQGDAGVLMRNVKMFSYFPNVFGIHGSCGNEAIELGGEAAKNYFGVHAFSTWDEDVPEIKKLREIVLKYYPNSKPRPVMYQLGWYWGKIISEGLKRAGREVDGERLVDALETFRDFDTGGLSGPVTYTPEFHKATNYCKVFKTDMNKRRLVPVTGWLKSAK